MSANDPYQYPIDDGTQITPTPTYNPSGSPSGVPTTTPSVGAGTPVVSDWQKYLPLILAGGGSLTQLLGAKLGSNQIAQGNQLAQQNSQKLWDLANQQQQTQSGLRNLFLPALLQNMGYKGQIPQQFQNTQGNAIPGAPGANSSTGNIPMPNAPPSSQPSAAASKLGTAAAVAGAGTGIAGAAGLLGSSGALAGSGGLLAGLGTAMPYIAPALLIGSLIASKIGQGRRAANSFVQGVENPFGAQLAQIVKEKDAGQLPQAKQDFQTDYANYLNQANQWKAAGGKQALVAGQSLTNPALQQTIATLKQQLGLT